MSSTPKRPKISSAWTTRSSSPGSHPTSPTRDRSPSVIMGCTPMPTGVYYYPNMKPDIIESLIDNGYKGIIIAGTGLGHVNKPLYPALRRAQEKGIAMYMTVQTLWGYVQMFVYDTGRDIMELGVVPAANMLPEVAYVKLGWALGQSSDLTKVKEIMLTSIAGEITEREPHNGYLIFQGGIPEVERFVSTFWK